MDNVIELKQPPKVSEVGSYQYNLYVGVGSIWENKFPDPEPTLNVYAYKNRLINLIKRGVISRGDLEDLSGKTLGCQGTIYDGIQEVIVEIWKKRNDILCQKQT